MKSVLQTLKQKFFGPDFENKSRNFPKAFNVKTDLQIDHAFLKKDGNQQVLRLGSGEEFCAITPTHRRMSLVGRSTDGQKFIKIGIANLPSRRRTIAEEAEIIKHLNGQGCISCPTLHSAGQVEKDLLLEVVDDEAKELVRDQDVIYFDYIVIDYLPSAEKIPFGDAVLSLIEQKSLGVYCGDFKPRNLRYSDETGVCYIVDYDQALMLDQEISQLPMDQFVTWADAEEKKQFNQRNFLRQFTEFNAREAFKGMFKGGAFNLLNASLMQRQETTRTIDGVYHSISSPLIYSDGIRTLDQRLELLNKLSWVTGEKVLDIGCNAGLLSFYLADIGCRVTGVDMDPYIITLNGFIANILGKDAQFQTIDLDEDPLPGNDFDTIMLFSVLHHTQNVEANAIKVASATKRIVMECRLVENGLKPVNGKWVETSKWAFENMDGLKTYLETIFPNFKVQNEVGLGDRDRYMVELIKH